MTRSRTSCDERVEGAGSETSTSSYRVPSGVESTKDSCRAGRAEEARGESAAAGSACRRRFPVDGAVWMARVSVGVQ